MNANIRSDQKQKKLPLLILLIILMTFDTTSAITTMRIATGLSNPVYAVAPPGDTERLFILEQHTGKIRILNLLIHQINGTDFLDIDGLGTDFEQGLLGLAFDPNYADNGHFYVNVTVAGTGATEISRYTVSANPDIADPASESLLLTWAQPQANHNGGWIAFGPDGYLYIASGDGGGSNDNDAGHTTDLGNGQDTTKLLGKLLRIDVTGDDFPGDATRNYSIPSDNPFVGVSGNDEIWAYGLRNPWRCSFDRLTGDLYIGDVGQGEQEEIDFQPAASIGGENYGWRVLEGELCNYPNDPLPCDDPVFTDPIHVYNHAGSRSVTGGYVYRGPRADLHGVYFFADYATAQIWTFEYDGTTKTNFTDRTAEMAPGVGAISSISSFAEDGLGNLYILDLFGGELFKILPEPVLAGDYNGDGFVDLIDFSWFAQLWQATNCNYCGGFDTNADFNIDLTDLQEFANSWLQ